MYTYKQARNYKKEKRIPSQWMYNNRASIAQILDEISTPFIVIHPHNRDRAATEICEEEILANPVVGHAFY